MRAIVLKLDDPRIGTPEKAPAVDVFGNAYRRPVLNRAELGDGLYVVLPVGMREPVQVSIEKEIKSRSKSNEISD